MHKSVLQKEVLQHLDPKPNENFIDATLGLAGHSLAILEKNKPKGKVLGVGPGIYPGCPTCNNELRKPDVKLGDIVVFGKFTGIEVDESMFMIRDSDILATLGKADG